MATATETRKTERTPGVWTYVIQDHTPGLAIITDYGVNGPLPALIARTNGTNFDNARLIAAAPSLLAALERAKEFLGGPWTAPEDVIDQVNAALAKATGNA